MSKSTAAQVTGVAEDLAARIQDGSLRPGTALPTHRQLAATHGIAISSATKVYAKLKSIGLVVGETGRGTFVRDRPPQREWDGDDEARLHRSAVDLSFNHPTLPGQAELLRNMLRELAASQHLSLKPVSALADGPDLDALDALCRRGRIRAIYTMPTLHNPLGWVLSARQRQGLVDIARRHDCLLIEDASYAFLAHQAPPALAALAPERTVYVSSLSKSLSSGLRCGFVLAPQDRAGRFKAAIRASYWSLPGVITAMASRWIADGTVARQEALLRQDARERQAIARDVLAGMDVTANPNSMFLWLALPEDLRMDRMAMALAERGIAVSKAQAYATTRHVPHALRLGLSSPPLVQLRAVLEQLRHTIEQFPI